MLTAPGFAHGGSAGAPSVPVGVKYAARTRRVQTRIVVLSVWTLLSPPVICNANGLLGPPNNARSA